MIDEQSVLVITSRFIITFLIPAMVWITLGTGLVQLLWTNIHRIGTILTGSPRQTKPAH